MGHLAMMQDKALPPYRSSLAGTLLSARESVMRPLRPALRAANLTDPQWRVLRVLSDHGQVEPSKLADAALLHAPSVTRILRELVQRGLIDRRTDQHDGRRSILRVTAEGRRLVDQTAEQTRQRLREYATLFGAERLAALRSELSALVEVLEPLQPTD